MAKRIVTEPAITYDDLLLNPDKIRGDVTIDTINLKTPLVRYESGLRRELSSKERGGSLALNIPLISAPMQSVTGTEMAIELAKHGGLGVIYCSQPIEDQEQMIRNVKKEKAGRVIPDVFSPDTPISRIAEYAKKKGYSTFPITENGQPHGRLVGLITGKDYDERTHSGMKASERMIKKEEDKLVAPIEDKLYEPCRDGTISPLKKANEILLESHHGAIPIIDKEDHLLYMVFRKDIMRHRDYPRELVDDATKSYLVGAAINTMDYEDRMPAVIEAGADILFIESSQGFSEYQEKVMEYLVKKYSDVPFIGGNIVTEDGFDFLVNNGAYGVKVGMGPGSICSTRDTFNIGEPQARAIMRVARKRDEHLEKTGAYVPITADGGIKKDAHIVIALALGADSVMGGRFFAGFHESPTEIVKRGIQQSGNVYTSPFKPYWGEGSERAKAWRQNRYDQADIPEGIEGFVPYLGYMRDVLPRTIAHIATTMQKCGYKDIAELHQKAILAVQSASSINEGKPHSIVMPEVWGQYSKAE